MRLLNYYIRNEGFLKKNGSKGDIATMNNLPQSLKEVLDQLKNTNDRDEVYSILDEATSRVEGFKALDLSTFSYKGYKLQVGLQTYLDEYA